MTSLARNVRFATDAIRATAPHAIRAGKPAPAFALHSLASLQKAKEPIASAESFTAAPVQGTQHWVKWQYSHTEDVRVDPRASPQSPIETVKHFQEGYVAAMGEIPANQPTDSEQNVVADRSDEDPLPTSKHHTIQLPQTWPLPNPTESEADVAADRSATDPLATILRRTKV